MNNIPKDLRQELADNPYMKICLRRKEGNCKGRITWEHALINSGRQVQKAFAILPICEYHHLGKGMDKRKHEWLALSRATEAELDEISKAKDWRQWKKYLDTIYEEKPLTSENNSK